MLAQMNELATTSTGRRLRLSRAVNQQRDQIIRLHLAGLVDSDALSLDATLDADLADVEATYAEGLFIVATFEDSPDALVGMGALLRIGGDWHIKRMRVDAEHRRQGIAQVVLTRLLAEAHLRGVPALLLDTAFQQEAAQQLYERNGFVHIDDLQIGGIPSRVYQLVLKS